MSRLLQETLKTFPELARVIPPRNGKRTAPSTVLRWVLRGVPRPGGGDRVRLEAFRLGNRWMTSMEAFERFVVAQQPDAGRENAAESRTMNQRRRASDAAASELTAAGI